MSVSYIGCFKLEEGVVTVDISLVAFRLLRLVTETTDVGTTTSIILESFTLTAVDFLSEFLLPDLTTLRFKYRLISGFRPS